MGNTPSAMLFSWRYRTFLISCATSITCVKRPNWCMQHRFRKSPENYLTALEEKLIPVALANSPGCLSYGVIKRMKRSRFKRFRLRCPLNVAATYMAENCPALYRAVLHSPAADMERAA